MKICHVITRLIVGGAQENTLLTCHGLARMGHRVTLIAGSETGPEGSLWDCTANAGYDVISLPSLRRAVHPWNDWRAVKHLHALFHRLRPDVVHTHSSKAGIVAREAARRAGVPIIVHTIHGMSFNRTQSRCVQWAYRQLERRAAKSTTHFIAVANAMIEQSVAAGIALRDRFTTIRSGIEVDRFTPNGESRRCVRAEWGFDEGAVVVGTVARLFKNKGYEEILSAIPTAVAHNDRLRFVWIGDGPNRKEYERRLADLGLVDRVRFVGLVPPDAMPALINGFDILLHASRWEGLPRAIVQGFLLEVPAVSFANDGAPEVVRPGETGYLITMMRIKALADAVVELAGDPELRLRLGRRGRALCLEMFNHRRMVEHIDALYRKLLSEATLGRIEG